MLEINSEMLSKSFILPFLHFSTHASEYMYEYP